MSEISLLAEYGKVAIQGILGISAMVSIILAWLNYRKSNQIKELEEERDYLKKSIHKVTSKVDPESDRKLLSQAPKGVQIMGINSLGSLHHCREEIIEFLNTQKGSLQIMLLDPSSDAFRERVFQENDRCMRLLSEWSASISILKDIQLHANGSIELRLRSAAPDRSLFIVDALDGVSDKTKMVINYYPKESNTRGYSGAQFMAEAVMERDRDSIFKNVDFFLNCWNDAIPISLEAAINLANQEECGREIERVNMQERR